MTERPRGLGRGLGALIPTGPDAEGPAPGSWGVEHGGVPAGAGGDVGSASWTTSDQTSRGEAVVVTSDAAELNGSGESEEAPASPQGALVPTRGAYLLDVPVEAVAVNPRQPRQVFDDEELTELAASITAVGLLQPIVVRPTNDEGRYELVMGERRWRAAQRAGLATVPAIVRTTADEDMLRDALLENLHRSQLNPLEEAAAYDQLLQDFSCTHEELSRRLGRSRPQITNTLRLLRLPPMVQRRVAAGVLTAGHARALLGMSDPAAQERVAQRIVAEGLSVRAVEEIVALGDESEGRASRTTRARTPAPELAEISTRLSDRFETRVRVDAGERKGRIVVEFAGREDLDRILALLEPSSSD